VVAENSVNMRSCKLQKSAVASARPGAGSRWRPLTGMALMLALLTHASGLAAQPAHLFGSTAQWDLLQGYCIDCHNSDDWSGQLSFEFIDPENIAAGAELWEKVIRKLRSGMMPPPGSTRPANAQVDAMVAWLETGLDQVEHLAVGHVPLHRLNRAEYANAVEDLLGLPVDPEALLPVDGVEHGFDNIASALKVSPAFIDQYVSAAQTLSEMAVGSAAVEPQSEIHDFFVAGQEGHVHGLPLGTRGGVVVEHFFPADGTYTLNIGNLVSTGGSPAQEFAQTLLVTLDGRRIFELELGGDERRRQLDQLQAPEVDRVNQLLKNITFDASAGPHKVAVTFRHRSFALHDAQLKALAPTAAGLPMLDIRQFDIFGPVAVHGRGTTPSRSRIFTCNPPAGDEVRESACAREIVEKLAWRAFRGQLDQADVTNLLGMYEYGYRRAGGFEEGVKHALAAMLVHPKFLYRFEQPPEGLAGSSNYVLDALELASRLAFFLWSGPPDEALLTAARAGDLLEPEVLAAHVRRMLQDPRARSLAENFALQWLGIGPLAAITPDPRLFPDVPAGIKDDMLEELILFVDNIFFREDRGVPALLDADYTWLNERLALHYGIRDVRGDQFRRVTLADANRHGLLGKGAILMVSSYPNRTSPVLRGAWVLENLLGTPPAAPPPNVEGLQENIIGETATTVRERLEQHRANPTCNNCHGVIDPLGFALENFDATGRWRQIDREAGTAIDATGVLPDGRPLRSPVDLRAALLAKPGEFAQTLTEELMTYALGRSLAHSDMPTVRAVVRTAAASGYRFSDIVVGIVMSTQFQMNSSVGDSSSTEAVATRQ